MSETKHDRLTEKDVSQYVLPNRVLVVLDECARQFGVAHSELRVLDWRCGRGMLVAKLLEVGFDAYGVDIDPGPIENGRPLFYILFRQNAD
jgi:2-polyprenyl-3-methyl-5-hydroxy-6-metoxy-1,4-benzoquinol methylase